jgi:hypothetical protein
LPLFGAISNQLILENALTQYRSATAKQKSARTTRVHEWTLKGEPQPNQTTTVPKRTPVRRAELGVRPRPAGPGVDDLPCWIPICKLVWRDHYRWVTGGRPGPITNVGTQPILATIGGI